GTEIAALLISKKSHLLRVGDVILILNIFIFGAAAIFLGVDSALYSVLTYFAASKTIDFLLHGIDEFTAITIMSDKSEEIRENIVRNSDHGVTVVKSRGGLTGNEKDILICVVTRLEIGTVKNLAHDIDGTAFILTHPLSDAQGGFIRKTVLH